MNVSKTLGMYWCPYTSCKTRLFESGLLLLKMHMVNSKVTTDFSFFFFFRRGVHDNPMVEIMLNHKQGSIKHKGGKQKGKKTERTSGTNRK